MRQRCSRLGFKLHLESKFCNYYYASIKYLLVNSKYEFKDLDDNTLSKHLKNQVMGSNFKAEPQIFMACILYFSPYKLPRKKWTATDMLLQLI
jgi:hypothetical protein